ncbi:MAG TPA: ATP-binding protein [Actinomycetota bacterium]|jgi:two-component system, OmpR family, sensor kinase|nr:ATP-binding protein [Actinomycetota bacterium]
MGTSAKERRLGGSIRFRVLASFTLLLSLAGLGIVLIQSVLLLRALDQRLYRELVQETEELRQLAEGVDPETGRPFGNNIDRLFEVYFERNVAARSEAIITFVGGEPFLRSRIVTPYRLDRDQRLVQRWTGIIEPEQGRVSTPAGDVLYLAVPVGPEGEDRGVFVVAVFRDLERAELQPALLSGIGVALILVVIGSLLALRLARGILTPVSQVHEAALSISESDLTRRIDVSGDDEVSRLADAFNQMLDRLEDAFGTQKRFLDDVGHELRTPITVIRGHLELLEDDPVEREQTIALVIDELDRMTRLVDDLLLLARAERPDFLRLETVDAGRLIQEVHAKATALAPREWRVEASAAGVIVADRQRLTQALMQLAHNAASHTEDGEVIALGCAIVDGEARFWVRDSGPGIPEEEQEVIFGRARQGKVGKKDGMGLGLSIVRAIAHAHGGRLELHSRPGSGATFGVVVPVEQERDALVSSPR